MSLTAIRGRSACWLLSAEPAQVRHAREQARKALFGWGLGEHAELGELIVSELVTNAIRHGDGPVRVRISHTRGDLRVAVHDQGASRPVRREVTAEDESGRGLALLDGLVELHGGRRGTVSGRGEPGKTVYVVISLPANGAGAR